MTPELCRAARGLLDWTQGDLAEKAHLSRPVIANYEKGANTMTRGNRLLLEMTFKEAGVEFTGGPEEYAGVIAVKRGLVTGDGDADE